MKVGGKKKIPLFVGYILQPNIEIWKVFLFSLWLKPRKNTDFFHYPLKFTNWCKFAQKNNLKQFLFIFFSYLGHLKLAMLMVYIGLL
jgi:hypothetical protein